MGAIATPDFVVRVGPRPGWSEFVKRVGWQQRVVSMTLGHFLRTSALLFLGLLPVVGQEPVQGAPYTPAQDAKGSWAFTADPNLPDVLILGDSISIAYTLPVRKLLAGKANVYRPLRGDGKGPDNCGDTTMGLANLDKWLGDRKWAVIHFNWGLWDLCYRHPDSKSAGKRDKVKGSVSTKPEDYEKNLEKLVARLEATGAKLIWASTTLVPEGEPGRFVGDDEKYNAIARKVMERHGIPIHDLHAVTKAFPADHFVGPGDVHFTPAASAKLAARVAEEIGKQLP